MNISKVILVHPIAVGKGLTDRTFDASKHHGLEISLEERSNVLRISYGQTRCLVPLAQVECMWMAADEQGQVVNTTNPALKKLK